MDSTPPPLPIAPLRAIHAGPSAELPVPPSQVGDALRSHLPASAVIEVDEPGRLRWRIPHRTAGTWRGYVVELQWSGTTETTVRSVGGIPAEGIQLWDANDDIGRGAHRVLQAAAAELGGSVSKRSRWRPVLRLTGLGIVVGLVGMMVADTLLPW